MTDGTSSHHVHRPRERVGQRKRLFATLGNLLHRSKMESSIVSEMVQPPTQPAVDARLQQQAEIAKALLDAQEQDRMRIASDLHDSIGQNLSVIKMNIESVHRELARQEGHEAEQQILAATLSHLRSTADELRRIALGLRPSMLEELGLLPTLEWCCREFSQSHPQLNLVKRIELEEQDVPADLRCDIYRLVQEGLHNVSKHATADNVEIVLKREGADLVLGIVDDGCGFEPKDEQGRGMGLYGMQARSERGGGQMVIHSAQNYETRLVFRWPLSE